MNVSAFTSRPGFHVRQKEARARSISFTFLDALIRYGHQLRQSELGETYKRTEISF
jgi:hypothetical protein